MKKTIPWAITWFMALMLVFSVNTRGQEVIAYWDQNSNDLPGGGFGFLADPDAFPQAADLGTGFLTVGGGLLLETNTNTNGDSIYTWIPSFGGTTLNAQPEVPSGGSISIQGGTDSGNNGSYIQILFPSDGYENLSITYATQRTSTGFNSQAWSWSSDGVSFTDISTFTAIESSFANTGVVTIDLPEAANDLENVYLRVTFSGATAATGNNRLDNITILGEEIVEEPVDYLTVFQFSAIDENLPSWFGSQLARGFATHGDNLYVANRNAPAGEQVQVHNRLTGALTGSLNTTGVSGGTFPLNDVEVSADGVVLLCNLAQSTGGIFTIYQLDETNPAEVLITLPLADIGASRMGDKFTVVGSFNDGSAKIYAADASTPRVFVWSMTADPDKQGFSFGAPEIIATNAIGATNGSNASVAPLPNGQFYITGGGVNIYKLNADGSLIGMVPGGIVATGSSALKYLGTDGDDEILAVFLYGAGNEKARILRIPNGDPTAAVIEFDTPTLGTTNSTGNADVTFLPATDDMNADLYVLSATNGLALYVTQNFDLEYPVYLPPQSPYLPARNLSIILPTWPLPVWMCL